MKSKILVGAVCFFALMCVGFQSEATINIVYPHEDVWVSTNILQVVGMLDGEKDGFVSVKVEGGTLLESRKSPTMNGAFNSTVKLKQGKNRIIITSRKAKAERTVYLAISEKDVPRGLKRYHVHPPTEIPTCNTCHELIGRSASYKKVFPTKANCTTGNCHSKIGKDEYVHGLLGAKVCVFCHNPHGSLLPNEISKAGGDLCISCHQEEKRTYRAKATMLPVREGDCAACHDPHESSQKFQLRGSSIQGFCFW